MVEALLFEYLVKTLAALPVGARSEDFFVTDKLLTNAAIKLVFPVPAYPLQEKFSGTN